MLHVGARTRSNALRPLQSADYEDGDDQILYIHTYIMCVTSTRDTSRAERRKNRANRCLEN